MTRIAAKFVPKLLNFNQKQHRINIAQAILDSVRDEPNLLQGVNPGDESWVYAYDVETKVQSTQWKLQHEDRRPKTEDRKKRVKFGQMWRFCLQFFLGAGA